jgi:hypothetical protein
MGSPDCNYTTGFAAKEQGAEGTSKYTMHEVWCAGVGSVRLLHEEVFGARVVVVVRGRAMYLNLIYAAGRSRQVLRWKM